MRTKLTFAVAGLVFSTATAVVAAEPQQIVEPQQISDGGSMSQQLVCHHMLHETMLTSATVCRTQRAWNQIRLQQQKTISDLQVRGYIQR